MVSRTSGVPDEQRLVGVEYVADLTGLSKPTIWRHCDAGRTVRWRMRTGNPRTGILDWLEAGCGPVAE